LDFNFFFVTVPRQFFLSPTEKLFGEFYFSLEFGKPATTGGGNKGKITEK
jgi:hypothetical protein